MEKMMVKTCPSSNTFICIAALTALYLGIAVIAAQLPIPFLSFESLVQRINAQSGPVQVAEANQTSYRFHSCSGGDSVNCHTTGNQAGL